MRHLSAASFILLLAACGQPAEPPSDAQAPPAGTGQSAAPLESEALVGVWSFDRSCASGDGMRLNADGTMTFDEWGEGTWETADNNRVVFTLARIEPGMGPSGETLNYTLDVAGVVTDDLSGALVRGDAEEVRAIYARRCPE
jgi:hypothetical protein